MQKLTQNKNILSLGISLLILLVLLMSSSFFHVLNKNIQNNYYTIKNTLLDFSANPQIIIVDIDDASLTEIGPFPFERSVYAQAIENLERFQVATIAFDLLFLEPRETQEDTPFIDVLSQNKNIVLGSAIDSTGTIITPFISQQQATYKSGFLAPNIDAGNKTVYSFTPKRQDSHGTTQEFFALQILRSFYEAVYRNSFYGIMGNANGNSYMFTPDIAIPFASQGQDSILINFIPPESFTHISFKDVYSLDALREITKNTYLKDKIILIGPSAEGLKDTFFTPNGIEPGVNIHANTVNTILSREYMMYFNKYLEWLLIFLVITLSVFINLSASTRTIIIGNTTIMLVFWILFPVSILLGTNLILNYPSEIIISLILAFASANIVKYLIEDQNKLKLNKALSEYVGSDIAEEILSEKGKVNLDGQERQLICVFSDIEGFTSLSETFTPKQLVAFLREYLGKMTEIIMDAGGYVDKFEGDAIMAFWGGFHEISDADYVTVCDSALRRKEALEVLNEEWKARLPYPISVRIGIHAGPAIVGNIGAMGRKMDFTALGDTVNLASRLEGINKFYGTKVCVSERIYEAVEPYFDFRYLDVIQVKGKDIPVRIYELLGKKGELTQEQKDIFEAFGKAQELYLQREFEKAREIFMSLSLSGDTVSENYVAHCDYFLLNPPDENWKGVWRMNEK